MLINCLDVIEQVLLVYGWGFVLLMAVSVAVGLYKVLSHRIALHWRKAEKSGGTVTHQSASLCQPITKRLLSCQQCVRCWR